MFESVTLATRKAASGVVCLECILGNVVHLDCSKYSHSLVAQKLGAEPLGCVEQVALILPVVRMVIIGS